MGPTRLGQAMRACVTTYRPYAPRAGAGAGAGAKQAAPSGSPAQPGARGADRLECPAPTADAVLLRHSRSPYLPYDVGRPEADGDDDALSVTVPAPDLDELAGFVGRIRQLGAQLGRAIMLGGGLWAVKATVEAAEGLGDGARAHERLEQQAGAHRARAQAADATPATRGAARAHRALACVLETEASTTRLGWWTNLVLMPGSAFMAGNLLGSAELLGALWRPLVPVADALMLPAVGFMAVYGLLVAVQAGIEMLRARREARALAALQQHDGLAPDQLEAAQALLRGRRAQAVRYDAALAAAGVAQAVGAVAQWAIGPVWLLVLIPGTLALGISKYYRAKALSQAPSTPADDAAAAALLAPERQLLARAHAAQAERTALAASKSPGDVQARVRLALAGALAARQIEPELQQRLRAAAQGPLDAAEALTRALAALQMFAPLGLHVAYDTSFARTPAARDDGETYLMTAAQVAQLAAEGTEQDQRATCLRLHAAAADILGSIGRASATRRLEAASAVLAARLSAA